MAKNLMYILMGLMITTVPVALRRINGFSKESAKESEYAQRLETPDTLVTHIVKPKECLIEITGEYWNKESGINFYDHGKKIQKDNGIKDNLIYPGDSLKIPIYKPRK